MNGAEEHWWIFVRPDNYIHILCMGGMFFVTIPCYMDIIISTTTAMRIVPNRKQRHEAKECNEPRTGNNIIIDFLQPRLRRTMCYRTKMESCFPEILMLEFCCCCSLYFL